MLCDSCTLFQRILALYNLYKVKITSKGEFCTPGRPCPQGYPVPPPEQHQSIVVSLQGIEARVFQLLSTSGYTRGAQCCQSVASF
jgi:hypothetical protein